MHEKRPPLIKPGLFGLDVAADRRRGVFDSHNESLLARAIPIDAVFIGDSITEMWPIDAYFQGSQGLIVNRGVGGDRTPFVRRRFEADVVQLHPKLVVIKIGVNNFWDLDIWWDPTLLRTPAEIEEEIVEDSTMLVENALAHDITVALCSILPTKIPVNANTGVRNAAIERVNQRLQHLAVQREITFVDYHRHFVADDGLTLREGVADDGLHPHALGYNIMAEVLFDALAKDSISVITARG
jgi:lysophospholipase L1-like esterase